MATTSGKSWRQAREEGIELLFPSGNIAAIRPVEVDFFVLHGSVPDPLADAVSKLIMQEPTELPLLPKEQMEKAKKEWIPFLNQLAMFAFVHPQVKESAASADLDDDTMTVDDLSYMDKVYLYRYLFARPANALRKFREIQERAVASLDDQQTPGNTAEPASGDTGHGAASPGGPGRGDGALPGQRGDDVRDLRGEQAVRAG